MIFLRRLISISAGVTAAMMLSACASGARDPIIVEIDHDQGGGADADRDAAAQCSAYGLNAALVDEMSDRSGRRRHRRYECR